MAQQVFITSHPNDKRVVERILEVLDEQNLKYFHSEEDAPPKTIAKQLRKSNVFVYVISAKSATLPRCRLQLREAMTMNLSVVPAVIDMRAPTLPELQQIPTITMTAGASPTELQQLLAQIPRGGGKKAAPPPKVDTSTRAGQGALSLPPRRLSWRRVLFELVVATILVTLVILGAFMVLGNDDDEGPNIGFAVDIPDFDADVDNDDLQNVVDDDRDSSSQVDDADAVIEGATATATEPDTAPTVDDGPTPTATYTLLIDADDDADPTPTITRTPEAETVAPTATNTPTFTITPTPSPTASLPAALLFVSDRDGNPALYINLEGATDWQLISEPGLWVQHPAWSADGRQVVYAAGGGLDFDLYLADVEAGTNTLLLDTIGQITHPSFSPDGRQIIYSNNDTGNFDLYILTIADGTVQPLTTDPANDFDADWSPDGQRIVFVSSRDGDEELYVMDVNGQNVEQLTANIAADLGPQWSPNGETIAYYSNPSGSSFEIFALNVATRDIRQLTALGMMSITPNWDRDSSSVVFSTNVTGSNDVYRIAVEGDGVPRTVLGIAGSDELFPSTRP